MTEVAGSGMRSRYHGERLGGSLAGMDAPTVPTYSQHGEDLEIHRLLQRRRTRRFAIDVGANDGRTWSNTYLLGQLGYSLLLIEPMPAYADKCRQLYDGRKDVIVESIAIAQRRGEATFFIHSDEATDLLAMRSSLREDFLPTPNKTEIRVNVCPLKDLLTKHRWPKNYALLNVDAEGSDLDVLESASLDRWRPHIICVEEGHSATSTIPSYLAQFNYRRLMECGPNGIYVRAEPARLSFFGWLRGDVHRQTA